MLRRDDIIVVCVWLALLLYALVANVIVVLGVLRNDRMRQSPSYWLILSLSVCDIAMAVISLAHIVPSTALHDSFLPSIYGWRNIIVIFVYDFFWYTAVLELGMMAINRYVSIVYPMEYKLWFSKQRTKYMIFMVYLLGVAVSVPALHPCCHTIYNHYEWMTVYHPSDSPYAYVDLVVNTTVVVIMVPCYAVILYKVHANQRALRRYKHNHSKLVDGSANTLLRSGGGASAPATRSLSQVVGPRGGQLNRRETRLFIQFFVVSLVFVLTYSTWQWLPRTISSIAEHNRKWAAFTLTTFFFINNSVNPTVYLIFNSTLRREVRRLLPFHPRSSTSAPVTNANNNSSSSLPNKNNRQHVALRLMYSAARRHNYIVYVVEEGEGRSSLRPDESTIDLHTTYV